MKAGSKRRRGKAEIKEQKRVEAVRQADIATKLAKIAEMEQQLHAYKQSAAQVASLG